MTQPDPAQVQRYLAVHWGNLRKLANKGSEKSTREQLSLYCEQIRETALQLQGDSLETLKAQVNSLYQLVMQRWGIELIAGDPLLHQMFVLRVCEQELLRVSEIRELVPQVLQNMEQAAKSGDIARLYLLLGGMVGGVVGMKNEILV